MLHENLLLRVHLFGGMKLLHIRLMPREVPLTDTLVVILENNIVQVGDFVAPKIHRGDHVLGLAGCVPLHHALFFQDVGNG